MNTANFSSELVSYLVLVPAALLCFLPMRNKLRYGSTFSVVAMISVLIIIIASGAAIESSVELPTNTLFLPIVGFCFILYCALVTTPIYKSAGIFMFVTTLLGFVTNISYGLFNEVKSSVDALGTSTQSATLQLTMIVFICLLFAYPLYNAGSWLVDNLEVRSVWRTTVLISGLFLVFNLLVFPRQDSILDIDEVSAFYWSAVIIMFILYLLLMVMFYYIVKGMLDMTKMDERRRLLEMEESQFIKQQAYMKDSQEARHDFKHAIRTLNELCKEGDFEAVSDFIERYSDSLPENDITRYSDNNAVNATMNYYADAAARSNIRIDWIASIPDNIPLTDIELCSLIGNILENAILACQEIPEEERWIQLTAQAPTGSQFLIVATNSFNGKVRKRRGKYLSTRRNSTGIGLTSITRTAERYGGSAEFSHNGKEFYTNVIIPLDQELTEELPDIK